MFNPEEMIKIKKVIKDKKCGKLKYNKIVEILDRLRVLTYEKEYIEPNEMTGWQ